MIIKECVTMHVGDCEPDTQAVVSMLRAIRDHPTHFSYGAISIAAGTAADILDGSTAAMSQQGEARAQCEGQLSILDLWGDG